MEVLTNIKSTRAPSFGSTGDLFTLFRSILFKSIQTTSLYLLLNKEHADERIEDKLHVRAPLISQRRSKDILLNNDVSIAC